MTTLANFPGLLEAFFTDRLLRQQQASPHTIASYRDTFRLLLKFVSLRLKKAPSALLPAARRPGSSPHWRVPRPPGERARHQRPPRNVRLAAVHSFFKCAAFHQPAHSALIQRVLAMPSKRYDKSAIEFLSSSESDALVAAPDQQTWIGRRDRALLLLAVQSGLRVSELVGLRCQDIVLGSGAHVRCLGKGRKERCTPLRKEAVTLLQAWLREQNAPPANPLFPNNRGGQLSRDAVEDLLAKHLRTASLRCQTFTQKRVSPHVLRHTAAMDLLQHGVDRSVIAFWLAHESVETTQVYLHANLKLKEAALARTAPLNVRAGRYRPGDRLLAFLKSL